MGVNPFEIGNISAYKKRLPVKKTGSLFFMFGKGIYICVPLGWEMFFKASWALS